MTTVNVLCAGSLEGALTKILGLDQFKGKDIKVQYGYSGLLKDQAIKGTPCDLFISANKEFAQQLGSYKKWSVLSEVAANDFVMTALTETLEYPRTDAWDKLRDPSIRLGSQKPGTTACGDYAMQVISVIGEKEEYLGNHLTERFVALCGGENSPEIPEGMSPAQFFIKKGECDAFLGYGSWFRKNGVPEGLTLLPLDEVAKIPVAYWATGDESQKPEVKELLDFIVSANGQKIFEEFGFLPIK